MFGLELKHIDHYTVSQSDNSDEAIKAYDKAIEINPHDSFSWKFKGLALNHLNKYGEAIPVLDKAIELNSHDSFFWAGKGDALFGLNKFDESIKAYDKATALNSQYSKA